MSATISGILNLIEQTSMNYGCLAQHLIDKITCVRSELEAREKKATEMI